MRYKIVLYFGIALVSFFFVACSENKREPEVVDLWENGVPTQNGVTAAEELLGGNYLIKNVSIPQLYIYKPSSKSNGRAVVICPGGGYDALGITHEGIAFAEWLNTKGITGVVLKYRMPNKHKDIPLQDAQQAIRYVRQHAEQLGIDPNQIGIAGFSAGGHLASTASVHYEKEDVSSRPDFSILFYPIITMGENTHEDSKRLLLGDNPSEEDVNYFSSNLYVTEDTPPTVLFLSQDDDQVPAINSAMYYEALKKNNVSASIYAFPKGRHGWGMSPYHMEFRYYDEMLLLLDRWLLDLN